MTKAAIIRDVMTPLPHSIEITRSVKEAKETMELHDVRHLPVEKDGEIVGILSQRNVLFATGLEASGKARLFVDDVYTPEPYMVESDTKLANVLETMAKERYGCALVCDQGDLVGIFTTTDACRMFADFLLTAENQEICSVF